MSRQSVYSNRYYFVFVLQLPVVIVLVDRLIIWNVVSIETVSKAQLMAHQNVDGSTAVGHFVVMCLLLLFLRFLFFYCFLRTINIPLILHLCSFTSVVIAYVPDICVTCKSSNRLRRRQHPVHYRCFFSKADLISERLFCQELVLSA